MIPNQMPNFNTPMMGYGTAPLANPYMLSSQPNSMSVNNGINWVQGIEGAKAFQMAPNSNIQLMDSDNDGIFYIKMCDNIGMCKLRIFRYNEITDTPTATPAVDMSQYVTRDELNELLSSLQSKKVGGKVNGKQSISTVERTVE